MAAWAFLGAQLLVGLFVLLSFNTFAIALGIASLGLVALYPFMKRWTYWPQAFLGLTFNWGALMGWAAIHESLSVAPVLLYAGSILWTVGYDTIYAHQDKEDDLTIGVKSSALKLGYATPIWLVLFYGGMLSLFVAAGIFSGIGWAYFPGLLAVAAHVLWQIRTVDVDRPGLCLKLFKSNRDLGALMLAAILLGWLI
jgi:4-hydroxybenzoate polyprenyltransferase